jgi:hypothetical protein
MGWKLWQKSSVSAPTSQPSSASTDWPTEACDSIRALAALHRRDVDPFTEWRHLEFAVDQKLESLFRKHVRVHRVNTWFSMYLLQRGEVEAGMLRDAFPYMMDELFPNAGMRERSRDLLVLQADAIDYFLRLSDEVKEAAVNGTTLESTPQWHFALHLLRVDPDSPFATKGRVPETQRRALAACLEKASDDAQDTFAPMLQAIQRFDASKLPYWEWSKTLGAHERHLQRRHNNPLFAPGRRVVTVSDVYSARVLDAKDYEEASQALMAIGEELRDFKFTPHWHVVLNEKKAQIEALEYRIAGMDRRGDKLRPRVQFLRKHAIGYMTDILKTFNPARLPGIEEAETAHARFFAQNSSDWSWQVYRGDVIPDDEASQALLSESAESIAQIVKGAGQFQHPHGFLPRARAELLPIVRGAYAAGHNIPGLERKLEILGIRVKR